MVSVGFEEGESFRENLYENEGKTKEDELERMGSSLNSKEEGMSFGRERTSSPRIHPLRSTTPPRARPINTHSVGVRKSMQRKKERESISFVRSLRC